MDNDFKEQDRMKRVITRSHTSFCYQKTSLMTQYIIFTSCLPIILSLLCELLTYIRTNSVAALWWGWVSIAEYEPYIKAKTNKKLKLLVLKHKKKTTKNSLYQD